MKYFSIFIFCCALFFAQQNLSAQTPRQNGTLIEPKPKIEAADSFEIYASDNRITVKNAPVGKKMELYSVLGLKVKEYDIKLKNQEFVVDIPKGYYIVRIEEVVRRIAIR